MRVLSGGAQLQSAHQAREAAAREGFEDEYNCRWCERLIEDEERELGRLRFEVFRGIG